MQERKGWLMKEGLYESHLHNTWWKEKGGWKKVFGFRKREVGERRDKKIVLWKNSFITQKRMKRDTTSEKRKLIGWKFKS